MVQLFLNQKIGKNVEGLYRIVTIEADSESAATSEFDRLSKINDDILRHMITKVEA